MTEGKIVYRQIKNSNFSKENLGFGDGQTHRNLGFCFGFGYRNNTNLCLSAMWDELLLLLGRIVYA